MNGFVRVVAIGALALLSACSRVQGVMTPLQIEAPPGASRVDMLVATTRSAKNVSQAEMFSGERGEGLAFADISISLPPDGVRKIGEVQWPEHLPPDPSREFATLRADALDSKEAFARFDAKSKRTRQVLVFVHGYNTRFEDAVYRFAQIVHDLGADAAPVLFTWPSRGKLLDYGYDHESASYSRDALERVSAMRSCRINPSAKSRCSRIRWAIG